MQITFLGATKTVTGSKYLVTVDNKKILVDCGLFQGLKELRLRNWDKLPVDPASIHAVILTHAHIDHTGYLPLLVKNGFTGKIFCSAATRDLCAILLPDSGYLQEEEAYFANKHGFSKHKPALPLYTKADAEYSLKQFVPLAFDQPYDLLKNFSITLRHSGHILGSSFVLLQHHKTSLLFSGDLGRPHDAIMQAPETFQAVDYLVLESTYGNRSHGDKDPMEELATIINRTVKRGGTIVIPAFAVGRAQLMLYFVYHLKAAGKIPSIPVFLDSPMSVSATNLLHKYSHEHRLRRSECDSICAVATYVNTPEESKALDTNKMPKIIIKVFITHGELDAAKTLCDRIINQLKWQCVVPDYLQTEKLN